MSPESSSERRSDLITDDKSELKEASAASLWGRFNGPWQDDSSRSALWRWRDLKKKKVFCLEFQRDCGECVWLHSSFIALREKWWRWLMKTADTHTGIIEFSFRIAVRQSEWAYSAYYTFRSGLQVSDMFSLHSYVYHLPKKKRWSSSEKAQTLHVLKYICHLEVDCCFSMPWATHA